MADKPFPCTFGCGTEIMAKRNGQRSIWVETQTGRGHTCPNKPKQAGTATVKPPITPGIHTGAQEAPAPTPAPEPVIDLDAVFAAIEEIEREEQMAKPVPVAPKVQFTNGQVPTLDPAYLIDSAHVKIVRSLIRMLEASGEPQNLGLFGLAGSGKTSMSLQIGALRGSPTFVLDSTSKQSSDEWFGTYTVESGTLVYHASDLIQAIETPGATVILDDVALLQNRTVQNGLNGILDPTRRGLYLEALGREVKVAPGVLIIGTWNPAGDGYVASELSAQILDRFASGSVLEVPYPDNGALTAILSAKTGLSPALAEPLANMVDWFRADPSMPEVSSRALLAAAAHVKNGLTYGEAIFGTVLRNLDIAEKTKAYGLITRKCDGDAAKLAAWQGPVTGTYAPFTSL